MEARVTYKDAPVGDKTYRFNKMDARLACYLFATISANTATGTTLLTALGKFSQDKFNEIQNHALRFIQWLDERDGNVFPTPILSGDGKWADKDLALDPAIVMALTTESILFNIQPFLESNQSTDQP